MKKHKINCKKIARQTTFTLGNMGAFLSALLLSFHLYLSRRGLWESLAERAEYDTTCLCVTAASLVLLSIASLFFYDEITTKKERKK